jgi:hypothetical protein
MLTIRRAATLRRGVKKTKDFRLKITDKEGQTHVTPPSQTDYSNHTHH